MAPHQVVASPQARLAVLDQTPSDTRAPSAALGMQLRLALNGLWREAARGSTETEIVVRLKAQDRLSPETLGQTEVFTPQGPRTVGDVATVTMQPSPSVIEHFDRQRRVMVFASPSAFASLGETAAAFKSALEKAPLPSGHSIFYDGQMKLLGEQNDAFSIVFILAVAFVYMVLASQFESFKHPFTILASVPLALVGALLALLVFRWSLTLGAMIGLILLMGLVTKNAILLVDGAAEPEAGRSRHRAAQGRAAPAEADPHDVGGDGHRHGAHRHRPRPGLRVPRAHGHRRHRGRVVVDLPHPLRRATRLLGRRAADPQAAQAEGRRR
jgi:multidrug efflux pump subunit AcrB